jgi:hypothetical protein
MAHRGDVLFAKMAEMNVKWFAYALVAATIAAIGVFIYENANIKAQSAQSVDSRVPEALRAPSAEKVSLRAVGVGKQVYKCQANQAHGGAFEWVLEKPQAELRDENGRTIGKHYEGPTWENVDGSKVVGVVRSHADAPQAGSIPWLLLEAKSNAGSGAFAHVTYVQRIETRGGVAPSAGCDAAHAGAENSVDYQATYVFYVPVH